MLGMVLGHMVLSQLRSELEKITNYEFSTAPRWKKFPRRFQSIIENQEGKLKVEKNSRNYRVTVVVSLINEQAKE